MLQLPKEGLFFEKLPGTPKKLVSVLAISIPVIDSCEEVVRVFCIYYSVQFQKGQEQVRALLNSGSEVNTMSSAYVEKLDFKAWKTNIGA